MTQIETSYQGNTHIKPANVPHKWTAEDIEEFIKCRDDLLYFCKTYVKLVHVDKGIVPFIPYDFQEKILKCFEDNRFAVIKCSRQLGKTSCTVAYLLHYCMFHSNKSVGILANKGATAREILQRFKFAFERLPKFLQQGVTEYNKGTIIFENGCKVIASATSNSAIRGQSMSVVAIDEVAFIPKNIWDEFYKSVYPTLTSGGETKMLMTSTPNGLNHFYKIWKDAENGRNSFARFSVDWRAVPSRDEEWKRKEIENLGGANIGERAFRQEHENQFLGSADTLIDLVTLQRLAWESPQFENEMGFKQYKLPVKGNRYVMTVDTARGVGLDNNAFIIVDVTKRPYEVVATFYNNHISSLAYPDIVHHCAMTYNEAWVLVELNDNGETVANVLYGTMEYPNLIPVIRSGRAGQKASFMGKGPTQLGIRTSQPTKSLGCSVFKSLVEQEKFIYTDENLITETINFVAHNDSYRATEGEHDDLIMCGVNFAWLTTQPIFEDITNLSFSALRKEVVEKQTVETTEEFPDFMVFDADNDGVLGGEDGFFF